MRVLFAGVDDQIRTLLEENLNQQGHSLESVDNGLSCITILRAAAPDVLVMENRLLWGGSDGVLGYMESDHLLAAIPVIVLSDTPSIDGTSEDAGAVHQVIQSYRLLPSIDTEILRAIHGIHSRIVTSRPEQHPFHSIRVESIRIV